MTGTDRADVVRDVVVVGGGAAGLSAALTLARARRTVMVVDGGRPRNAPADGVHGLLALEGTSPRELLARGREEVVGYGGEVVAGDVADVAAAPYGFDVVLRDGATLAARRLLIATGLVDELPDVPGVREHWGHGVLHCPYCHGWEVRDRRLGVLGTDPMAVHKALLFRQWSSDVVLLAGDLELDAEQRAQLDAVGVEVVAGGIAALESAADGVSGVRLADGRVVAVDAVVVATRMVARAEPFAGIGIVPTTHPMGAFLEADAFGRTAVPGVWAAGNVSDLAAQVSMAAADGARAAQDINADLLMADVERAVAEKDTMTHSFDKDYWDQVWGDDRGTAMAAARVNPHLVEEVAALAPGSALEAGCGAGAEAVWLAAQGWRVTGVDVADAALAVAADRASTAGVGDRLRWVRADLSSWEPESPYDLVTTHYAHPAMPQLEFYDRIASWVAPGGTLLVVGHLHTGDEHGHGHGHDDGPPAEASVTATDVTTRLDPSVWDVVTAREAERTAPGPGGRTSTLHDVVVRAVRRR